MKIAAVVIGLFVAGLAYVSYKGWAAMEDVKWAAMEDASRSTLTNASEQVVHALNNTATQFASHPSAVAASGLPVAATFGFVPGLMMGLNDPISDYCHKFGKAKVVEQLRTILHIGKINVSPTHLAFADLPFDIIITTNFDFLLEMAYEQRSRQYIPILGEDQLSISKLSSDNNITTILKIHGDLNHPNKMVITEEDYDSYITNHPLMSTYIANLLITRTPLFIGYSLDDPDFRGIWQIVKSRLGNLQRYAYALSNQLNNTKITKFERRGINLIVIGSSVLENK